METYQKMNPMLECDIMLLCTVIIVDMDIERFRVHRIQRN